MACHGGQVLVGQLQQFGVTRVFSVPGESFLAVLDGLHGSGIENIVCRHEGGAAMMAEAMGKMTGRPGVVFVTRGPGATNASSAIHVARQDSTPLVMFVGQIAREHRDREAFQELNYRAVFGTMAKWVAEVDQVERLPEYVARAFRVAQSGRPGPVVLALPEDMLSSACAAPLLPAFRVEPPKPDPEAVAKVMGHIEMAERPLVVVGGSVWSARAAKDLERFARTHDLPVAVTFRRQDYMDNASPHYVGDLGVGMNPALAQRLRDCDLLLLIGTRFGDIPTNGYQLVKPGAEGKVVVHVHPDFPESWLRTDLAISAGGPEAICTFSKEKCTKRTKVSDWRAAARADYERWQEPVETPGLVKMEAVVRWLSDNLPADAIMTNGAGNYAAFLHRYFRFKQHGTQLAPTSGSMGYGFPAAVSASLQHPDRMVVCLAGDGCFQMTLNEMSTAMQHGARPIVIVANNGRYGTIRMHQERTYPARVSGTDLANPDYAALAMAYGGHGEVVENGDEFPAAFARARAAGVLSVIELRLDSEALSTGLTLSATRELGRAG